MSVKLITCIQEYPVEEDRGGKPEDKENFVSLLTEMRAAFGSRYGISLTLPAGYYSLQHFDVASMQASVDWFNFMAYDLHGTWDNPPLIGKSATNLSQKLI